MQFSVNQFIELAVINWNRVMGKAKTQVESCKKGSFYAWKNPLFECCSFPVFIYWCLASTFLPPKSAIDKL